MRGTTCLLPAWPFAKGSAVPFVENCHLKANRKWACTGLLSARPLALLACWQHGHLPKAAQWPLWETATERAIENGLARAFYQQGRWKATVQGPLAGGTMAMGLQWQKQNGHRRAIGHQRAIQRPVLSCCGVFNDVGPRGQFAAS